jgi:hypothetical protein
MKKQKLKSLVKTARKAERKKIKSNIFLELKAVAEKLVPTSKKIEKVIKKEAKELAKVISLEIKIDKAALVVAHTQQKDTSADIHKENDQTAAPIAGEIITVDKSVIKPSGTKAPKKLVKA